MAAGTAELASDDGSGNITDWQHFEDQMRGYDQVGSNAVPQRIRMGFYDRDMMVAPTLSSIVQERLSRKKGLETDLQRPRAAFLGGLATTVRKPEVRLKKGPGLVETRNFGLQDVGSYVLRDAGYYGQVTFAENGMGPEQLG